MQITNIASGQALSVIKPETQHTCHTTRSPFGARSKKSDCRREIAFRLMPLMGKQGTPPLLITASTMRNSLAKKSNKHTKQSRFA
ncbi:hypothetical protein [Aeromonas salmonicida]|uniref:hypothetical protein n=1 Tax=Aeromonas salmonicida TaxID=645 RepID=UPI0010416C9E|nr:hypothetical protein [Aeromonas salmonicida]